MNAYTTLFQPGSDHLGKLDIDGTKTSSNRNKRMPAITDVTHRVCKRQGISRIAGQPSASQEGLCSLQLGNVNDENPVINYSLSGFALLDTTNKCQPCRRSLLQHVLLQADVYLTEEEGVAAIWRDAPVLMFEPRTSNIPVAIEIPSNESHHIGRRPLGLLEAPATAPASPVVAITVAVLVQNPGAEHRLYEAEELLHVGLQEVRSQQVVTEVHRLVPAATNGTGHHMVGAPPIPGQGGGRLHHRATSASSIHVL